MTELQIHWEPSQEDFPVSLFKKSFLTLPPTWVQASPSATPGTPIWRDSNIKINQISHQTNWTCFLLGYPALKHWAELGLTEDLFHKRQINVPASRWVFLEFAHFRLRPFLPSYNRCITAPCRPPCRPRFCPPCPPRPAGRPPPCKGLPAASQESFRIDLRWHTDRGAK